MALNVKYFSEEHQADFNNAYVRIVEGTFKKDTLDLSVAIYPSVNGRSKEREWEDAQKKVDLAQVAVYDIKNELEKIEIQTEKVRDIRNKAFADWNAKKISEEEFQKLDNDLKNSISKLADILGTFNKAKEDEMRIRGEAEVALQVKPLKMQKYTFPVTLDELNSGNILQLAYSKLKEVPMYKDAVDTED